MTASLSAPWRADYRPWGGVPSARHRVLRPASVDEAAAALASLGASPSGAPPALAWGCGRSYGDVPLNPEGVLIDCGALDRFVSFDHATGLLTAEAGVRLADILAVVCRPEADGGGWFLPVTPGTRFVTLGGAIANDVHGKNHHSYGNFGRHVRAIELARSDGSRFLCSPGDENAALFAATVGGLGLTGLILRATVQLRRVPGTALEAEDIRFGTLDEFFALAAESEAAEWEYTAAWVDCLASEPSTGRGIFSRARHAPGVAAPPPPLAPTRAVPFTPPFSFVGRRSVKAFNALYWRKLGRAERARRVGGYEPVFYPLDAIGGWNRLYGPRGFHQFQCAVPPAAAEAAAAELLRAVAASGEGSMLSVLKTFGALPSPGLLSFPMEGATLALDLPNRGASTERLLARLEAITLAAGGRLYPAKDMLMSAQAFRAGYPRFEEFRPLMDPRLSSGFARRVGLRETPAAPSLPEATAA